MKDIKFVKGDSVKVTQERFKDALLKQGWVILEEKKPAEVKKPAKKAKKDDDSSADN